MGTLKQITKETSSLQEDEIQQIIALHQNFFDLSAEDIIKFMRHRDEVDLYYDQHGKLVGTVGIQRDEVDGKKIIYIGNAVIDKDYHGKGLLTQSLVKPVVKMLCKNLFKKNYVILFATSMGAYNYIAKFKYAWPKPFEPVPEYPRYLLEEFLKLNYPNQYEVHENAFLIKQKEGELSSKTSDREPGDFSSLWFTLTNSNYKTGQQLPCIVQVNLVNVFVLVASSIPKLYRTNKLISKVKNGVFSIGKKDHFYWVLIGLILLL